MRDRTHSTRVEVRVHDGERERERVAAERGETDALYFIPEERNDFYNKRVFSAQ